jgi:hypothetical protein
MGSGGSSVNSARRVVAVEQHAFGHAVVQQRGDAPNALALRQGAPSRPA